MLSLIVFDLDGTLVDSRRDLAEATNLLLETCGASPLPEEKVGRMVGDGARTLVARAFAAAGKTPPPDALERFLRIYDGRLLVHTRAYPQIDELLTVLDGRASLAVLTNKPLGATRAILDGLNLARHFDADAVVGGDGPFPRKPDPAGLRHLLARAAVPASAAVLVGDSRVDWRTARAADVRACLARYGFGFEDALIPDLGAGDRIIEAPLDLLTL